MFYISQANFIPILNSLKTWNAVWTVLVRSMLLKIVQILARVDSVVNGITHCYILIIRLSLLTLSNRRCSHPRIENVIAIAHLLSKTVAPKPSSKILLATTYVRIYSPHKRFVTVRMLLDQESVSTFISLLNAYAFRELMAPFPLPALAKCNSSCVHHAAQNTIIPASPNGPAYYDRVYTSIINEIFTESIYTIGNTSPDSNPMNSDPLDIIIDVDYIFGMLVLDSVRKGFEHSLSRKIRFSAGFFPEQ